MKDFTLSMYELLLINLQKNGYNFITFEDSITNPHNGKQIILRHDVDKLPYNSLDTAKVEHKLGIKGVYYFRIVKESNDPKVIKEIAALGHEIGYHYEDMALTKGNIDNAIHDFEKNLAYFRQFYPVRTICMHGSPMSKWDNKKIWEKYNYKNYGIIGEPYFDINFDEFCYLTDTGRRWDGDKVSVRDKVKSTFNLHFHSTTDIINGISKLPNKIMITTHPQRWSNNQIIWIKELILQSIKNIVKRIIAS